MTILVPIGDFSRMTHLSIKALRHYHDVGLLVPASIDTDTGYRSYDTDQVPIAQAIRRFRDLGMPLDQVGRVINASDNDERSREIISHLAAMEQKLDDVQQAVAGLRALIEAPPLRRSIAIRTIPSAQALAVRDVVSVADAGTWWADVFEELHVFLDAAGTAPSGPNGALFAPEFFQHEKGEVTAFVPVADDIRGRGRITSLLVPAVQAAVMEHHGPLAEVDRTYGALGSTVAERAIGVDAPIREYYLTSYADTENEAEHRTEICWPVLHQAGRSEAAADAGRS